MLLQLTTRLARRDPSSISRIASLHRRVSTATPRPDVYDVVCIGGGPAGLSLLTALGALPETRHLKTALVEAQQLPVPTSTSGFSNRCSSLTPASISFLTAIGAWSRVDLIRTQPYHKIRVWDGVSGSSINFDSENSLFADVRAVIPGENAHKGVSDRLATMIENVNLTSALASQLTSASKVDVYDNTRVRDIALGVEDSQLDLRSWPVVSLDNGQTLAARLLVGADGANSPVRAFSGINSRGWDYDRHGVVATLRLKPDDPAVGSAVTPRPRTAYQRFLPTGPVALLPLPGDYASLVWSTTPERAAKLKTMSGADFVAMANAAFRLLPVDLDYMHTMDSGYADEAAWRTTATLVDPHKVPPEIVDVQDRSVASFPLRMRHADTYVGERVALIGDAAHSIHPLAGQGLNQGLGDARALARQIRSAVEVGRDIGGSFTLDEYNAAQWSKNNAMLGTVDKLHKLYSASSGPVVWARSLGLDAVDKLGWLKAFLMKQAAGVK